MKEHITVEIIESCEKNIQQVKKWTFVSAGPTMMLSLRRLHTSNLYCEKAYPAGSPVLYTVAMHNLALTGKQKEIDQCLYEVEMAHDIVNQPIPSPLTGERFL